MTTGWFCFSRKQSKTQTPATTGHHHASSHPPSAPSGQSTAYPGKFGKSLGASIVALPAWHVPHTPGSGHQFPPTRFFSTIRQTHESKCIRPRCHLCFFYLSARWLQPPPTNTQQTVPPACRSLTCQRPRSASGCRRGRTCASRAARGGSGSPRRMAAETQSGHTPAVPPAGAAGWRGRSVRRKGQAHGPGGAGAGSLCPSRSEPTFSLGAYLFKMEMEMDLH